ncbi:MAG: DUF2029 domain-containing protein [Clostridiales bacterium]|nr:DUF2029 domain-containing protein [Clostridiales bacterium]
MTDRKKLLRLGIVAAVLLAVYFLLIAVLPKISVWSSVQRYNYSPNVTERPINIGSVYQYTFEMPYDRVCGIDINMKNPASYVVGVDGLIELYDINGNVVMSKKITSAYDSAFMQSYVPVNAGERYTLEVTINDIGGGSGSVRPTVQFNALDELIFQIHGAGSGTADRTPFALLYLVISAMILLFTFFYDRKGLGEAVLCDRIMLGTLIILSIFMLSQYYDLFMIIKSALRMFDSFKSGNLTDYYGYSYTAELQNQSNKMLFAYEYNFFQIFFTLILIFPLTFFYNGDLYGGGFDGLVAVTYLTIVIALLLFVALRLIRNTVKACGMSDDYRRAAEMLFIFSPMLIYMMVAYGQIDIMYMIVILFALPFYYKKQYRRFALIMSLAVAMKTLPLLIFFPMILLANKKIRDIAVNTLIVMAGPVLTHVLFEGSAGHKAIGRIIEEDYSYVSRIAETRIGDSLSLFILAFIVICIICFIHKPDTDDGKQMLYKSQLAVFAVYGMFVVFVNWHQQWMIPLVLAGSFLLPFFKDSRMLLLNVVMEFLYILTADIRGASVYKINFGMMSFFTGEYSDAPEVSVIANNISSIMPAAVFTCLAAVIICLTVIFYRGKDELNTETVECDRRLVTGRCGILFVFILFYAWAFTFVG